jgi:hypothetical protein
MPGFTTFGAPALHVKVAPVVDELAVKTTIDTAQVKVCAPETVTCGKSPSASIIIDVELEHPFAGFVTVAVYIPGWFTVGFGGQFGGILPPDQQI